MSGGMYGNDMYMFAMASDVLPDVAPHYCYWSDESSTRVLALPLADCLLMAILLDDRSEGIDCRPTTILFDDSGQIASCESSVFHAGNLDWSLLSQARFLAFSNTHLSMRLSQVAYRSWPIFRNARIFC